MKDIIRKTPEFQALRAQAQEAIADYADGADFDWTISRLAPIGEKMTELLPYRQNDLAKTKPTPITDG